MALPNDSFRISEELAKLANSSPSYAADPRKAARGLIRRTITIVKPAADAMAADTTAYTAAQMIRMRAPGRVLGAAFLPQSTATASDTVYATINVVTADGAAGAGVVAASQTTKTAVSGGSGNLAAGTTVPLTVSATDANRRYVAGAVLGFTIAKASTGTIVPAGVLSIDIEEEGPDGYSV